MSAKNTGKASEKLWESHFTRLGKAAYFHRIVDASEIKGRTGVVGRSVRASPSDYMLTYRGVTAYSEVKSTENKTSFSFSMISQTAAAKQIVAAGGAYNVYVHSLVHDQWYLIPWLVIVAVKNSGKESIKWDQLEALKWEINS